jgi:hypothetical protein
VIYELRKSYLQRFRVSTGFARKCEIDAIYLWKSGADIEKGALVLTILTEKNG